MLTKHKMVIASVLLIAVFVTCGWAVGRMLGKMLYPPPAECHMKQDCDHVKSTCNRKTGCKCQLRCDPEGRRLPPAGGVSECPSYCCEEKCECHAMGCP
jgi:hypothetical protein